MADPARQQAAPVAIRNPQSLENLWKVWKVPGPGVDFSRELVVVQTTRGSRLRLTAARGDHGDPEVLGLASRDLRPGFR